MSEKTWRKAHYPRAASTIARDYERGKVDAVALVDHSLAKWEGALPKNLKAHGLGRPPIEFDADSCALCIEFFDHDAPRWEWMCEGCPLYTVLGARCDDVGEPFDEYTWGYGPEPMIRALKKARKVAASKKWLKAQEVRRA